MAEIAENTETLVRCRLDSQLSFVDCRLQTALLHFICCDNNLKQTKIQVHKYEHESLKSLRLCTSYLFITEEDKLDATCRFLRINTA